MSGTIYIIKNKENDKVYVGQTTSTLSERFRHHKSSILASDKKNMKLYSAMREIGVDKFYIKPLEEHVPDHCQIFKEKPL